MNKRSRLKLEKQHLGVLWFWRKAQRALRVDVPHQERDGSLTFRGETIAPAWYPGCGRPLVVKLRSAP